MPVYLKFCLISGFEEDEELYFLESLGEKEKKEYFE